MDLLNKIFGRKKKDITEQIVHQKFMKENISLDDKIDFQVDKRGFVSTNKRQVDYSVLNALKQRYIALDVETTEVHITIELLR